VAFYSDLENCFVEYCDIFMALNIYQRLAENSLSPGLLNYILTQEEKSWYVASKVAALADVYFDNKATVVDYRAS